MLSTTHSTRWLAVSSFRRLIHTGRPSSGRGDNHRANGGDGDLTRIHFGRIVLHNKRHLRRHKEEMGMMGKSKANRYPDVPIHRYGTRPEGVKQPFSFQPIPEMRAELVVPDLEGFKLKPYVSYRARDIHQEELSAKDLFNAVYGKKVG